MTTTSTATPTATIRCGHCSGRHETVAEVANCAAYEFAPIEVCCFSCDALIGWAEPTDPAPELPRGCGGPGICRRDFPASF